MLGSYDDARRLSWVVTRTTPATEPVSRTEAKTFLKLDGTDEDTLVDLLIRSAVETLERETGLALITQTITCRADTAPQLGPETLPVAPASVITSIQTLDADRTATTVDSNTYYLDAAGRLPMLGLLADHLWPEVGAASGGFVVTYTAGYGASSTSVPGDLRLAVLNLVAWHYQNRGDLQAPELPEQVRRVISRYTLGGLF